MSKSRLSCLMATKRPIRGSRRDRVRPCRHDRSGRPPRSGLGSVGSSRYFWKDLTIAGTGRHHAAEGPRLCPPLPALANGECASLTRPRRGGGMSVAPAESMERRRTIGAHGVPLAVTRKAPVVEEEAMVEQRGPEDSSTSDASAYEGRADNPAPDTDVARRGPAAGSGSPDNDRRLREDVAREGGGSSTERD